ncbi:DUF2987 domain-containing protein [Rheinheimera sp. WS51]|uniref:DUF2987 domain-containing protein n=1 Tax=Rheinheimera sp. WS51 TaxID=3425886 RepID=UPI003D8C3633
MYKFLFLVLLTALPSHATMMISYDSLYKKMKTLQKPEFTDLTLAFLLTNTDRKGECRFIDLRLTSDIHNVPLFLFANGEINLPYDEALKDSKARLILQQADNHPSCELTLRLRTRMPLQQTMSQQELNHFQQQFTLVLTELAGSVSKRWLPEVTGVIAVFSQQDSPEHQLTPEQQDVTKCQQQRCEIRLKALDAPATRQWHFAEKPIYLLPLLEQNNPAN